MCKNMCITYTYIYILYMLVPAPPSLPAQGFRVKNAQIPGLDLILGP